MRISWKRGQMLPTFDYTITVLNRRMGRDSSDKLDAWKKTVIPFCSWSTQTVRNVTGTEVSLGASFIVRVPKLADYRPYFEWKTDMQGVTFSVGDIIIKGEVTEEITPENVQSVVKKYPESFAISIFKDNTGTIEALEHYRIEGV